MSYSISKDNFLIILVYKQLRYFIPFFSQDFAFQKQTIVSDRSHFTWRPSMMSQSFQFVLNTSSELCRSFLSLYSGPTNSPGQTLCRLVQFQTKVIDHLNTDLSCTLLSIQTDKLLKSLMHILDDTGSRLTSPIPYPAPVLTTVVIVLLGPSMYLCA